MDSQPSGATQYDRLVEVMGELRERSRHIIEEAQAANPRPKLVFFYGKTSGQSRRAEAFVAQILQRRHNHETFELVRVCAESHPELVEHFRVKELPTLVVVEERRIRVRVENPRGRRDIETALRPWLR